MVSQQDLSQSRLIEIGRNSTQMSALQKYLAENYLNASNPNDTTENEVSLDQSGTDYELRDKKKKKKKSKKSKQNESVRVIDDGDDDLFRSNRDSDEEEALGDTEIEHIPEQKILEPKVQKKTSGNGWKKVGETNSADMPTLESNTSVRIKEEEEQDIKPTMLKHGLQTPDQVTAYLKHKEETERAMIESLERPEQETVYRDASGRRIDIQAKRREAQLEAQRAEEKRKHLLKNINKGIVQQEQKEAERLLEQQGLSYTRNINDADRNRELQARVDTFNDPAAGFLSQKRLSRKHEQLQEGTVNLREMKQYKGHYTPNRFGIAPGYRWDGVDRSNGFESLWIKKQREREERKNLEYKLSYDV